MTTATAVCWGVIALLSMVAGWRHPRTRHVPQRVRDRVEAD